MVMSGVSICEECVHVFDELKMGHQFQYIIYRVSNDLKKVEVEDIGSLQNTYDDFVGRLMEAKQKRQCRYAVFDVKFYQNQMPQQKLAFFFWSPDSATTAQKMLYASTKGSFLRKLVGIPVIIQCNDDEDLLMCNVLDRCISRYT